MFIKILPYNNPQDPPTRQLIALEGVISVFYLQQRYNLPIKIYLPSSFPVVAPLAYVNPTSKMKISQKCRYVHPTSGLITSEYLKHWDYPAGNLVSLVGDLQIIFSSDPPLYESHDGNSSITSSNSPAMTTPAPASTSTPGNGLFAVNPLAAGAAAAASLWDGILGQGTPAQQQQSIQQQQQPSIWQGVLSQQQHGGSGTTTPPPPPPPPGVTPQPLVQQQRDVAYRISLSSTLSARLSYMLESSIHYEKEKHQTIQRKLQSRAAVLTQGMAALQKERETFEKASNQLSSLNASLDVWLRDNETKMDRIINTHDSSGIGGGGSSYSGIDPDEAIVAADALSHQAVLAQASDIAMEDSMHILEKVFEAKKIPIDAYLRQVRALSKRQFTARALSKKIAAQQKMSVREQPRQQEGRQKGGEVWDGSGGPLGVMSANNTSSAGLVNASTSPPAELPIGDAWHSTGGILVNPLAAAAQNLRLRE